jgi:uncharacterized membrane protein YdjX (TVP38/TMEM64 family)
VTGRDPRFSLRVLLVVLGVGALLAAALGAMLVREIGIDGLLGWIAAAWQQLQSAPPMVFFGAMALITIFPVPLSPFYIVAGTLYGVLPSLLWIPPAIVLNNLIAYTLTTTFLRPWLQSIVSRRGYSMPSFRSKRDQTLLIAIVRITPGPPYFLQSLVLGLAGVDRLRFLLVSLPVHMVYVVGFVVLGQSAFDGEVGLTIVAIVLIVGAAICARVAVKRLRRIQGSQAATPVDREN